MNFYHFKQIYISHSIEHKKSTACLDSIHLISIRLNLNHNIVFFRKTNYNCITLLSTKYIVFEVLNNSLR